MGISTIIPVHNSAIYLEECINSVLQQVQEDDEIILVENGSTDNSLDLCRKFEVSIPCIRCYDIGNKGVSAARNYGIVVAKGEWLCFLDSDDKLQSGAFQTLRNNGNANAEIIVAEYSNEKIDFEYEAVLEEIDPLLLAKSVLRYPLYEKKINRFFKTDCFSIWACWAKFFKRDFIIQNEIWFPEGIRLSEDAAFCLQAYCAAQHVFALRQVVYCYSLTPNSVIRQPQDDIVENNLKLITKFSDYIARFPKCRELDNECRAFCMRKMIEAFLLNKRLSKENIVNEFHKVPFADEVINKSFYLFLTLGKKNSIKFFYTQIKIKVLRKRIIRKLKS